MGATYELLCTKRRNARIIKTKEPYLFFFEKEFTYIDIGLSEPLWVFVDSGNICSLECRIKMELLWDKFYPEEFDRERI